MKTFCYTPRRIVRANHSEVIVRLNEVRSTLVSEVKDYATLVVCKNSLINFSSISNPILIVNKYSDIIPSKFKAVKFTL